MPEPCHRPACTVRTSQTMYTDRLVSSTTCGAPSRPGPTPGRHSGHPARRRPAHPGHPPTHWRPHPRAHPGPHPRLPTLRSPTRTTQKLLKCNDVSRHLSRCLRDITLVAGAGFELRPLGLQRLCHPVRRSLTALGDVCSDLRRRGQFQGPAPIIVTPSASIRRLALSFSGHIRGTTQIAIESRDQARLPGAWRRTPTDPHRGLGLVEAAQPPPGQARADRPALEECPARGRAGDGTVHGPLRSPDSTPAGGAEHGDSGTLLEVHSTWPLQRPSSDPCSC